MTRRRRSFPAPWQPDLRCAPIKAACMSGPEGKDGLDSATGLKQGVGARLLRKEDDRLMRGRGQFVADIRLAGLQDVAFVRTPLPPARIRSISLPDRFPYGVSTTADLSPAK